jgi:hypothetical protein
MGKENQGLRRSQQGKTIHGHSILACTLEWNGQVGQVNDWGVYCSAQTHTHTILLHLLVAGKTQRRSVEASADLAQLQSRVDDTSETLAGNQTSGNREAVHVKVLLKLLAPEPAGQGTTKNGVGVSCVEVSKNSFKTMGERSGLPESAPRTQATPMDIQLGRYSRYFSREPTR